MGIKLKADFDKAFIKMKDFRGLTLNDIDESMNKFAIIIKEHARQKISRGSRSGIIYKRTTRNKRGRKKKIIHQASSKFEYPKSDSSDLVDSIEASTGKRFKKHIGSNMPHAEWLEEGTKFMDPRSWLRRSRRESEPRMRRVLRLAFKRRGLV